jgi:aminocarboxymuconate-semialdehyde decarboxylase
VLFATDCPFGPEGGRAIIRATFEALDQLGLSAAERAAIMSGNARRALGLPPEATVQVPGGA